MIEKIKSVIIETFQFSQIQEEWINFKTKIKTIFRETGRIRANQKRIEKKRKQKNTKEIQKNIIKNYSLIF